MVVFFKSIFHTVQVPTSNLAATQLAAHAMSVSSGVRYNAMVMDQLRQPHPLHSPYSSSANTNSVAEKLGKFLAFSSTC